MWYCYLTRPISVYYIRLISKCQPILFSFKCNGCGVLYFIVFQCIILYVLYYILMLYYLYCIITLQLITAQRSRVKIYV
jgi:hypothetical protein